MSVQSHFSLSLLSKDDSQLEDFARLTIKYIPYMDYMTLEDELEKIRRTSTTTKFWILKDQSAIGVVKISLFHFYDLGLPNDVTQEELLVIIQAVEQKMRSSFTGKIHGQILTKYLASTQSLGWLEDYSRYQMHASLDEILDVDYSNLKYETYSDKHYSKIPALFIDAYKGSLDEKIGLFSKDAIYDSINDILVGVYGEFQPELSIVVHNKWGKLIGASLITLSEGCAFLIIIGVRQKYQRREIGRKLISFNKVKCKENGFECIKLWATKGIPAVDFYKSLGFRIINEVTAIQKSMMI